MKQVKFRSDLTEDEWPTDEHQLVEGHSISLGQFALLVKKDPSAARSTKTPPDNSDDMETEEQEQTTGAASSISNPKGNQKSASQYWPASLSTDWCPPGTSTVWSNQGTIHTCSDKLCRWNCLGLQGSLLASLLQEPLYMETLTVGRKLTECICRRAICCRAASAVNDKKKKQDRKRKCSGTKQNDKEASVVSQSEIGFRINHPAILGTAVYMDDTGIIDMSHRVDEKEKEEGQDVRFHSIMSWAWWPCIGMGDNFGADGDTQAECIDGATGLAIITGSKKNDEHPLGLEPNVFSENTVPLCNHSSGEAMSSLSTKALVDLYTDIMELLDDFKVPEHCRRIGFDLSTLAHFRAFKLQSSPDYETRKQELLSKHPLFRHWIRRANVKSGESD